jgi:sugar phosphate isomerase/epimerase
MKIIHLHAHENDGKDDEHLPPGSGKVDWNMVISHLKKLNFDGVLIVEQFDVFTALSAYDYLLAITKI